MTVYRGFEVLDFVEPNRGDGTAWEYLRPMEVVSNPPGKSGFRDRFEGARLGHQFLWICRTRAEKVQLREWIDEHRGACVPFWVPSYRRDLELSDQVSASAIAFRVRRAGYARLVFGNGLQRRHVCFYAAGTAPALFRGIISATESTDHEELGVDTAFPATLPIDTLVSFLVLVRLATDDVRIVHRGPSFATATLPLIELPQEVPEP